MLKITVLKRTIDRDLIDEYADDAYRDMGPCDRLGDGQEFVIESLEELAAVPEGFCPWAWADIRKDMVMIATGSDSPGFRQRGMAIAGCTDWLRPVIFKIERME